MIRATLIALLAIWSLPLAAQKAQKPATPTEDSTIERFRAHAKPRVVAPEAPLSAEERNTIRRFREAKSSVVFVSAILKGHDLRTQDSAKIPFGAGTGFVWDEWGHIVTNHHVVTVEEGGQRITEVQEVEVTLADGQTYKGRVIGFSFAYDIAVIQVFAPLQAMRPIPIGRSQSLQVGQSVMAIGNPFGLDHSLTKGVVSAKNRKIDTGYSTHILNAIQTDAAVNPGNSGGPLLDSGGRLVGMNTAIVATKGEGSVGVGFAIPVDTLNDIVPKLIARTRLEPPRMGFEVMTSALAQQSLGITQGLLVLSVDPASPAGRAGLRPLSVDAQGRVKEMGDILLAYQGRVIESEGQFMAMLEVETPKDEIEFDVLRSGEVIKVKLNLKGSKAGEPVKPQPASI
ncbi:S1C family serine protease [Geothrix sp. PMB-07]|uniref:S1C family serine protease n=1 Tax=Geothrix sp. PMB-07 TaxID=3068640 RepID=UPI002741AB72|nr:trypsin-like peptidase domain-containing protein [Geothrix sp. PMB-07]WLT31826.1 trypsin-like peptidase domain-containing protein [Geothrix sp. PMB-07]